MEKVSSRLRVLALLVLLMFAALTTRLWFLQVLATTEFVQKAQSNSIRFAHSDALRGRILDANDVPIVKNQPSLEVRVVRDDLVASGRAEQVLYRLSELLEVPVSEILRKLESNQYFSYQPKPVADFVSPKVYAAISERPRLFPGVEVVETSVREYPQGRTAAHIVGTIAQITADEFEDLDFNKRGKTYGLSDLVGRSGLEQVYEKWLRGTKGEQKFIVNSDQEVIRALGRIDPQPGHDLRLALDLDIQKIAEQELRLGMDRARTLRTSSGEQLKATSGVVVILDPSNGGVEAIVSVPAFDPNWYVEGLTKEQRRYLFESPFAPSLNRATQGDFFPGSTFKPMSGLAAVKAGFASLSGYYPCTTTYQHPGDTSGAEFSNWKPSNRSMTLGQALIESCDTWFYRFGSSFYGYWREHQLAKDGELMQKLFREWGFGSPTGIDLPLEGDGFMPTAEWAQGRKDLFEDGVWIPGGNILAMIGSTYLQATPLQVARAYMAIANRGHLCRPHLVDAIVDEGEVVREISGKCDKRVPGYTEEQLASVHQALLGVTSTGTAACAFGGFPLSQIPVAGKTGTAESPPKQDASWFTAIVGPVQDPDHVIVAMVEEGGFGSQTAAPIVRRIVERIYGLQPNPVGCAAAQED